MSGDPAAEARSLPGAADGEPTTRAGHAIRRLEIGLITLIFAAIVLIGLVQIGLRNFADSSLIWADPAMRAGVLWLTMLASALAAGQARHIKVDVLGRKLPSALRHWVARLMFFASALICLALTAASMNLLVLEYQINELAFLGVPRWIVLAIIPIGFTLMGWRFLRHAFGLSRTQETQA